MNYRAKRHAKLEEIHARREVSWGFYLKHGTGFAIVMMDHSQLVEVLDLVDLIAHDPSEENIKKLQTFWAQFSAELSNYMSIPDLRDGDPEVDIERMKVYHWPIA